MLAVGRFTDRENFVKRAYKCNRPKMTDIHGHTWDVVGTLQGGIDVMADTTWGFYGYFQKDNQWYKFKMI